MEKINNKSSKQQLNWHSYSFQIKIIKKMRKYFYWRDRKWEMYCVGLRVLGRAPHKVRMNYTSGQWNNTQSWNKWII